MNYDALIALLMNAIAAVLLLRLILRGNRSFAVLFWFAANLACVIWMIKILK